jgi:hypothetical protein
MRVSSGGFFHWVFWGVEVVEWPLVWASGRVFEVLGAET